MLTRADFKDWRLDVEFVASLYNVFLRRSQVKAVEVSLQNWPLTMKNADAIASLTAEDLIGTALASGDVNSVRAVLRKRNLDDKVQAIIVGASKALLSFHVS